MGKKEFLTIGLILICTTIFTAVYTNIAYAGQEASVSRTFVYAGTIFLGGLLIFGVPIFIIYLISVIYQTKEVQTKEMATSMSEYVRQRDMNIVNEKLEKSKISTKITELPEGKKYCSNCGQEIKKESMFCEFCGEKQ